MFAITEKGGVDRGLTVLANARFACAITSDFSVNQNRLDLIVSRESRQGPVSHQLYVNKAGELGKF